MITGHDIRRAREARRLSQEQLAAALKVGVRTVGRWERGETIPRSSLGAIEAVLGLGEGADPDQPTLGDATDAELLAELAVRLEKAKPGGRRSPARASQAEDAAYYRPHPQTGAAGATG